MRFTSKVVVLFSGVMALAAISAALAVLGGQQARYSLDRVDLVHRSYEAHLALSNHTYQLFKQFGDAMVIGDLDRGAMEAELLQSIRSDIARIRETLVEEIRYFGDDRADDRVGGRRPRRREGRVLRQRRAPLHRLGGPVRV